MTTTDGTFTGGEGEVTVSTVWQVSNTGSGSWSWLAKASGPLALAAAQDGKFVRSSSTGTDTIDQTANANSTAVGPVITPTEIKAVTITADGVLTTYGEPITCQANTPVAIEAAITGDANPSYKWEARGNYPMGVSDQAAITTLTFPLAGNATVTLTVTDRTATDSPITYGMNFYVASAAE